MTTLVLIWVWFCAYLNCAGWALSALHQLNAGGYASALLIFFGAAFFWRQKTSAQIFPAACGIKILRRFKKPFPLAFLILAAMAFLGGAIHAPNNYDTLAYRIPRVLHWLAADQWHWIHTDFVRVNIHSVGIEWVYAPVIALLKSDRLLFLINSLSFLFLPGLIFSIFTRLGVRRRVAWHWMWIVPTGYGFLLQAGGVGNDLFGATLLLAGIDFALRTNAEKSSWNFFTSLLAMAAATSSKSSNLPLLLPWAMILLPSIKLLLKRPWQTALICVVAAFASAAPLMALNTKYTGNWVGGMVKNAGVKNETLIRVGANMVLITIQNFVPPIFPLADRWNQAVEKNLPPKLADKLAQLIESPGCKFALPEMQMEENATLGFGICVLLVMSAVAARVDRRKHVSLRSAWLRSVGISIVVACVGILVMSRWTAIGRYFLPYYALLIPLFLADGGQEHLLRRGWWNLSVYVVFAMAAVLLILSPSRPLFPAQTIMEKLYARWPTSHWVMRAKTVYTVYHNRNRAFDPVIAILPPDLKLLGMITSDDPETTIWRPFGSRRIEHVCLEDAQESLKLRGIEYILVKEDMFDGWPGGTFDDWLKHVNGQIILKMPLEMRATDGVRNWDLVKLD